MTTKSWGSKTTIVKNLKPSLLGQANIPKPLHGINPRTIMGAAAWAKHRQVIVQNNPYCTACGAENCRLDLHEDYEIDYNTCIMKIRSYVPLCKRCHSFIHSGLLRVWVSEKTVSIQDARDILQHGIAICAQHRIQIFVGTARLANDLKVSLGIVRSWTPKIKSDWGPWKLQYGNKEYAGISYSEWVHKYGSS
jgi:hypothetical protein